jgi:hypothetical protein
MITEKNILAFLIAKSLNVLTNAKDLILMSGTASSILINSLMAIHHNT